MYDAIFSYFRMCNPSDRAIGGLECGACACVFGDSSLPATPPNKGVLQREKLTSLILSILQHKKFICEEQYVCVEGRGVVG